MSVSFTLERSPHVLADADREAILADPGFGRFFTDHMATACWTAERGWQESRVAARTPLVVDPAAAVLHYGQEILGPEGLPAR